MSLNRAYKTPSEQAYKIENVEQLLNHIKQSSSQLSKQLKTVGEYIIQYRHRIAIEKISTIANHCQVQPSTIIRFAKFFGFSGFSDLQAMFKSEFTNHNLDYSYTNRFSKIFTQSKQLNSAHEIIEQFIYANHFALKDLVQQIDQPKIDQCIELLRHAENIYIVGVRRVFPVVSYLSYGLQHVGLRNYLISGMGGMFREQIQSITKRDVLVAISFTPYGRETQYCARIAKRQKAKLIVIADGDLIPLASGADCLFKVYEASSHSFRALTCTMCLVQSLVISMAYTLQQNISELADIGEYDS